MILGFIAFYLTVGGAESLLHRARRISRCESSAVHSLPQQSSKADLLNLLDDLNFGVRATKEDSERIESLVATLKNSKSNLVRNLRPAAAFAAKNSWGNYRQRDLMGGDWRLKYTSGPDVLNIGKIPGVNLDHVGQIVDTERNIITNVVRASGFLADTSQEITVGASELGPAKVGLEFRAVKIQLLKVFGQDYIFGKSVRDFKPVEIQIEPQKLLEQIERSGRPAPTFEIEYIDNDLRVQRTGEGFLFIIQKLRTSNNAMAESFDSLLRDGAGPWLTNTLGEDAMKLFAVTIGVVPYVLFAVKGFAEIQSRLT